MWPKSLFDNTIATSLLSSRVSVCNAHAAMNRRSVSLRSTVGVEAEVDMYIELVCSDIMSQGQQKHLLKR